jgi:hypothetical protein
MLLQVITNICLLSGQRFYSHGDFKNHQELSGHCTGPRREAKESKGDI